MTEEQEVRWLAQTFSALSNENRVRMFQHLCRKAIECSAQDGCCDFSDRCCHLGELSANLAISQATVSHHLKELSRAGLVETRREGRYLHCAVNEDVVERLRVFLACGSLRSTAGLFLVGASCAGGASCTTERPTASLDSDSSDAN